MTGHPSHDALLKHHFGLEEDAPGMDVAQHLEECAECREKLDELAAGESALLDREGGARFELPAATAGSGWWRSRSVPLVAAGLCVAATIVLAYLRSTLSLAPIALGGILVSAWLTLVISGIERTWSMATDALRGALPADARDQLCFVQGLRLSARQSIKEVQADIRTLLISAALIGLCGGGAVGALGVAYPQGMAQAGIDGTTTLLVGLFGGAFFAGMIWGMLRLRALAANIGQVLNELQRLVSNGGDGSDGAVVA